MVREGGLRVVPPLRAGRGRVRHAPLRRPQTVPLLCSSIQKIGRDVETRVNDDSILRRYGIFFNSRNKKIENKRLIS